DRRGGGVNDGDGLSRLGGVAAGVGCLPGADKGTGVAALVAHWSVAVSDGDCSAGVAGGGGAGGAWVGRAGAFDDCIGHVADRRGGGVNDGDGLSGLCSVAAGIGCRPGADKRAGIVALAGP